MSIWQKLFGTKTGAGRQHAITRQGLGARQAPASPAGTVTTSSPRSRQSAAGAESHYNLGNTLYGKGDLDGAIREFQQAIRIRPNLWEARNNLGALLLAKGDLDAAVSACLELVTLAPEFPDGHTNLGNALYWKGDVNGAIAEYRESIRLKPGSA